MKSLWLFHISLTAVVFAAITAGATWALNAPALTVLQSAAAAFVTTVGLGLTAYRFFGTR